MPTSQRLRVVRGMLDGRSNAYIEAMTRPIRDTVRLPVINSITPIRRWLHYGNHAVAPIRQPSAGSNMPISRWLLYGGQCHCPPVFRWLSTRSDIRQYLLYIDKDSLHMPDGLQQSGLDYRYRIIDRHMVDCQTLLTQDNPEALVLAILCDFKGRPEHEVVHYILQRLHQRTAENESRFREYMRMLEVLSTNRALEQIIEEEEKMLSQVEQTRLPSYRIGMEQGMQQGMEQEAVHMLQRQLTRRFGLLSEPTLAMLNTASLHQLERWADNILDAKTLDEVFKY